MKIEIEIDIESIENGIIVGIENKKYFFKNSYGIGKYLQEELERMIDEGKKNEDA